MAEIKNSGKKGWKPFAKKPKEEERKARLEYPKEARGVSEDCNFDVKSTAISLLSL
jgi:hypothetical protein